MKDPDSYSYRGVKRRDFRQSKDGPESLPLTPAKKKKNKSGCKRNKYGPHIVRTIVEPRYVKYLQCRVICVYCGKDYSWCVDKIDGAAVRWQSDQDRLELLKYHDDPNQWRSYSRRIVAILKDGEDSESKTTN